MGSFGKVKRLFDYAQSLLDNGYKPEYVFDKVGPDREGISTIYIGDKHNFLNNEEGKILCTNGLMIHGISEAELLRLN